MIYKTFEAQYRDLPYPKNTGNKEKHSKDRVTHSSEVRRIDDAFHLALAQEYGLNDNPREGKVWQQAWELGHSSGYGEVEGYYQDLARILVD